MKKCLTILTVLLAICICMTVSVSAAELSDQENGKWIAQQAEKMTFPTDGSDHVAVCPVCCKSVTWYAVTEAQMTEGKSLSKGYHYYVADSVELSTEKALISGTSSTGNSCCLHLNGQTLVNNNFVVLSGSSGSMNVMGKGLIKGGRTGTDEGATVIMNSANDSASINIYGGTYEKADPASTANVMCVRGNGGRIRMYYGAEVNAGTAGSAVYIKKDLVYTNGGNVYVEAGAKASMYGGEITNGVATSGGNVYLPVAETEDTGAELCKHRKPGDRRRQQGPFCWL